jgi:cardiolipin synthase A/B
VSDSLPEGAGASWPTTRATQWVLDKVRRQRALLEAGVRIYLYPAPCVLHSKHFSIDDEVGVLSSSNMDKRSFGLNYEVSLMAVGLDIVGGLRKVEDTYREMSRELTIGERVRRPRRSRYLDNVMRLTAALQ